MTDIAIRVENLSKLYHIGKAQERHDTLRDALVSTFKRSNVRTSESSTDHWALKDVSFEVKRGEVVGIIGRNGAGKSTLLKILSRITEPTSGRVELHGRVASLLEVGTGFHPELTGRENIYLNGAILGMKRAEIDRQFDEIVAFAEIEKFLDTPVKRYSSGMYVRLAFAVAAHLEPEILLVDEVLAVGDAAFQKKCLGKMGEVAAHGKTVIFVSHNMGAVQRLCTTTRLFDKGKNEFSGQTNAVVERYLSMQSQIVKNNELYDLPRHTENLGQSIRFSKCIVLGFDGIKTTTVLFGEPIKVLLEAIGTETLDAISIGVRIENALGEPVAHGLSEDTGTFFIFEPPKRLRVIAALSHLRLAPGTYWITISMRSGSVGLDQVLQAVQFKVQETVFHPTIVPHSGVWGPVCIKLEWETIRENNAVNTRVDVK